MGYILLAILTIVVVMIRLGLRGRMADLRVPAICKIASLVVLHGGVILILGWADELTPEAPAETYWIVGLGCFLFSVGFWAALIPRRKKS